MATNFFTTNDYKDFEALMRVLGFTERLELHSAFKECFDKYGFTLFIEKDSSCCLYADQKLLVKGTWPSIKADIVDLSRDPMYKTLEEWLASRVTAASTYRLFANERMEAALKEHASMCSLEASLTKSLHDLRKTAQIAKEGHQ